jgi:hypothetical protein
MAKRFVNRQMIGAVGLTLLLAATINHESLWTDEAFSAFIASHRSLSSLWSTLHDGDSSDLQMAMYYIYLYFWGKCFGLSEVALRTANIPFALLFSGSLVWASKRLYNSRWAWLVAALSPLLWSFANDARPYFIIVSLSTVVIACLLVYLRRESEDGKTLLPWMVLGALLVGATFHMLMLLLVFPVCLLLCVFWRTERQSVRWVDWKRPLAVFAPLALAEVAFFLWTFMRGASYEYAHPDFLSMGSLLFRFAGLSGYYPNRRYDISVRPYLPTMAMASSAFLAALIALVLAAKGSLVKRTFYGLACALTGGIVQVVLLSIVMKQQIEARHLAALLPLLLFLVMTGLGSRPPLGRNGARGVACVLLTTVWLVSDLRLMFLPEYKREDFRGAVLKALEISSMTKADVALVADPAAAAYYGLFARGPKPCFPLSGTCQQGWAEVSWESKRPAVYGVLWRAGEVRDWLDDERRRGKSYVVLISRSRHPMYQGSPWWSQLRYAQYQQLYMFHGFYVYLFT